MAGRSVAPNETSSGQLENVSSEETSHDQRNCPKLHLFQRLTVSAANVEAARREHLTKPRESANI